MYQSLTAAIIVDHCASSGSSFQNCFAIFCCLLQALTFCAPPTDYCSFFILCTLLATSRAYTTTISNNQSLKPTTNNCLSIKHSLQLKTFLYLFQRSFQYCTMNGRVTNGISCLPHKYNGRAVCTRELHTTELMWYSIKGTGRSLGATTISNSGSWSTSANRMLCG